MRRARSISSETLAIACFAAATLLCQPRSAAATPAFVDVTAAANLSFVGSYGATLPNLPSVTALMQRNMGNGAAVGDYDGDGDLDVYLLGQWGHPNKLFRNDLPLKSFTDVTAAPLDDTGLSRVAHFADLDGDGDLDLLLVNDDDGATMPRSKIFRNDGGGSFTDVSMGSGFRPIGALQCGAAIADYDLDGLLDIHVSVWRDGSGNVGTLFGRNRLYRNLGNLEFEEVTDSVGLAGVEMLAFTAIFKDLGGDRHPDLLVAVDSGADRFFDNQGGVFSDASLGVGATHTGNDMGVAAADYDDDGDLDFYQTNITDSSGVYGLTQYNVLYENQWDSLGVPAFVDAAFAAGVEDTAWGWGTEFIDVEQDGDLDLVAVTGFDELVLTTSGAASPVYQTPSVLFVNDGSGSFVRLTGTGLDAADDSRGLVAFDYDRDGDTDLLITNVNQPVRLLENVSSDAGHWLAVDLGPHALAIGAEVYATTAGVTRRRDVLAGRSFLAGTPSEVHFGLGASTTVDELRVVWNDGSETAMMNVPADRLLTLDGDIELPLVGRGPLELLVTALLVAVTTRRRRGQDQPAC